ncbi:MAG TPA: methyltransferase [Spirochaetota bacterium]|nr:methyltransferase [Spirochaetota bacterium]
MMQSGRGDINPGFIRETAMAFRESRILLSAYELDLFSVIGSRTMDAGDIAHYAGTDVRATDRLLNALAAMGYLHKEGVAFRNTPGAQQFLDRNSPDYLAGLMHTSHLWESWSTLTEAVKAGTSVMKSMGDRGETWFRPFIAAMNDRAKSQAPVVAKLFDLSGVHRLLDVGGGSGVFSIAFARAAGHLHATVFDLPGVVAMTGEYIQQEGLAGRIDTMPGDYNHDKPAGTYDMIFLSAIIHSNSFEENRVLIENCAGALNSGGTIAVMDFIMDESRTAPAPGALFAINMLVNTEAGDTYTEGEVRGWMQGAGLVKMKRVETGFGSVIIQGYKKD